MAAQQETEYVDKIDSGSSEREEYDVIICGTDLVPSILSSALSRAGKKVLHCDGNGWYGGLDAVLCTGSTLQSFIDGCERLTNDATKQEKIETQSFDGKVQSKEGDKKSKEKDDGDGRLMSLNILPREKYGDLKLHSETIDSSCWKTTKKIVEVLSLGERENDNAEAPVCGENSINTKRPEEKFAKYDTLANENIIEENATVDNSQKATRRPTQQPELNKCDSGDFHTSPLPRGFSFDLSPSLLYASGDAVQGLIKSGVADYLEFKSLKGLYLFMSKEERGSLLTSGRRGARSRTTERSFGSREGHQKSFDKSNSTDHSCGTKGRSSDRVPQTALQKFTLFRVPCSKGDVFRSRLLSPADKRRLMKFLQLVSDYGMATQFGNISSSPMFDSAPDSSNMNKTLTSETNETFDTVGSNLSPDYSGKNSHQQNRATSAEHSLNDSATPAASGEDVVHSVNERHLNRGRSLSRPQNKAMPSSSEMTALIRCVQDNTNFHDFLTKVAKLPARLCTVVVHALALFPLALGDGEDRDVNTKRIYEYSTKEGVEDLLRHLTSLGRFGDTAFLLTLYGSGELSQAFCRSGAVYGSTYMLRRPPLSISLEKKNAGMTNETDGDTTLDCARSQNDMCVCGIVLGGEMSDEVDTSQVLDTEIGCKHVIVPSTMMSYPTNDNLRIRIYRRISVLRGKLIVSQESKDNIEGEDTEQRYFIVIPPLTPELENQSAIHGLAVDNSIFVSPSENNYTVLHLTTTVLEVEGTADNTCADMLSKAVQFLVATNTSEETNNADESPLEEYHHISFSYCDYPSSSGADGIPCSFCASGLHVCFRDNQSITCDSAFREAERIFREICPNSDFLALAKKVENSIVYKSAEDSDDEKMILESAFDIIHRPGKGEKAPE